MAEFNEFSDEEFLALGLVEITPDHPFKEEGRSWGHHIAIDIPLWRAKGAKDPANPMIWRRYVLEDVSDLLAAIDATKAAGGTDHQTQSYWLGDCWPASCHDGAFVNMGKGTIQPRCAAIRQILRVSFAKDMWFRELCRRPDIGSESGADDARSRRWHGPNDHSG